MVPPWLADMSRSAFSSSAPSTRFARPRLGPLAALDGHVVVRRPVLAGVLAGFTLTLAWAVGLTSYVVFRDEVLAGLAQRQQSVALAYEDRIAELRAEIEAARTRRLVESELVERKVEGLVRRQAALEARQQMMSTLAADRPTPPVTPRAADSGAPRPAPISDTVIVKPAPEREARLESRPTLPPVRAVAAADTPADRRIGDLQTALDRLELAQAGALNGLEERFDSRARRMRAVFAELGLDPARLAPKQSAVGGPFLPVTISGTFEAQAARVAATLGDLRRLEKAVAMVPLRRPLRGDADVTSGFGTRIDPFLKRLALHAGVDFRGETGTPVYATAAGRVAEAGWQGGYGNMVQIEHADGLSTLYGHLSAIDVAPGALVVAGQMIGRLGSTGRSTGPHVHYETHIDGDAVDPQRFLRAGVRLGLIEAN